MNKVILMGRIVRDFDVRYSQGKNKVAITRYTLAVNRRRVAKNAEQSTDFINVIAFGKSGEFAEKYFKKGMQILVTGTIQTGSYTNKEGQKVYTTEIIAEDQEFTERKGSEQNATVPSQTTADDGFMNIPDDVEDETLPFN